MAVKRPAAKTVKRPKPPAKKTSRSRPRTAAQLARDRQVNRDYAKRAYTAMTPAERAEWRWRKQAKPPTPRAGSARGQNPRVAALAMAFCDWSDIDEVVRTYVAAAVMSELTGDTYVVDHAVPLINPFVCGLHTHTNLQVITVEENRVKSNWLWPQMPALDWSMMDFLMQRQQKDRLKAANDDEQISATGTAG